MFRFVFISHVYLSIYFHGNNIEHLPVDCWLQGAELAADEGRSAAALAACRTLAEELTELRFPAPRILAFKVLFHLNGPHILLTVHCCVFILLANRQKNLMIWFYCRRGVLRLAILFLG